MSSTVLFPAERLSARSGSLVRRVTLMLATSLLVAATARIAFPLPFTPVPFTLQPLAVLVAGLLLGPVDGALALLLYLAEGVAGIPVFSPTGPGGLAQLFGPTGGYLLAYPAVAFLAGWAVRVLSLRMGRYAAGVVACSAAVIVLFSAGAAWLEHWHPMSGYALWTATVAPFLPGEIVKILIASGIYQALRHHPAR